MEEVLFVEDADDEEVEDGIIGAPIVAKVGGDMDDKDVSPRLVEDEDDDDGPLPAVNDEAAAAAATMEEEDTDMKIS